MKEAIEIKKALMTIADFLEIEPQSVASSICFLDKKRSDKFIEASKLWNSFDNEEDIVKRGEMLGIKVEKSGDNLEIIQELI
jgi:hypothetical protein